MALPSKQKRMSEEKEALKEYYRNFYGNNFYRDFRYIVFEKGVYPRFRNANKSKRKKENQERNILHFLLSPNNNGLGGKMMNEITYFPNQELYKGAGKDYSLNFKRYTDRLFLDFDVEDNPEVEALKDKISKAWETLKGNDLSTALEGYRMDFQDLIFEEHILEEVFYESKKVFDYFKEEFGVKPFLSFSGGKGFHINIFYNPSRFKNFSNLCLDLFGRLKNGLGLKYLDEAPSKDALKRCQGVQYAYHSNTGLLNRPLDGNIGYDEALKEIKRTDRTPIQFNLSDYEAPEDFVQMMGILDNNLHQKAMRNKEKQDYDNYLRMEARKKMAKANPKYKSNGDLENLSMRDVIRYYGISGKDRGDRISIKCPFHPDNNPSAVVFDKVFHCSSCNITYNYYSFIAHKEGTNDKSKIMEIAYSIAGQ